MENNEKQLPYEPTAQNLQEAFEQIRAAYTCGRVALANLAVLFTLDKKDTSWAEDMNKKVHDYFEVLISAYQDFERLYEAKLDEEPEKIVE